jgi:hypothetical protein
MSSYVPFFLVQNHLGLQTEHASELEKARELVQHGLNLMTQLTPQFEVEKGWLSAQGLSLRVVESCEATVILVDRGMAGAAWAPLRTAWECLFYAAALWRKPARFAEFTGAHHKERLTQVHALRKSAPPSLSPESIAKLETLAQDTGAHEKWPCFNAADEAGLKTEYELFYRGCGLAGAHATQRSLDRHLTQLKGAAEGEYVWTYAPNFDTAGIQIAWAIQCLALTMDRFQEQLTAVSGAEPQARTAPA